MGPSPMPDSRLSQSLLCDWVDSLASEVPEVETGGPECVPPPRAEACVCNTCTKAVEALVPVRDFVSKYKVNGS